MAISPQQLTIYLYSTHRAVIFAIAQLSCYNGCRDTAKRLNERLLSLLSNVVSTSVSVDKRITDYINNRQSQQQQWPVHAQQPANHGKFTNFLPRDATPRDASRGVATASRPSVRDVEAS